MLMVSILQANKKVLDFLNGLKQQKKLFYLWFVPLSPVCNIPHLLMRLVILRTLFYMLVVRPRFVLLWILHGCGSAVCVVLLCLAAQLMVRADSSGEPEAVTCVM